MLQWAHMRYRVTLPPLLHISKCSALFDSTSNKFMGASHVKILANKGIDLAKYTKSIFSILYILALFSLCVLPFIVSLFLLVLLGEDNGKWAPYHVSLVFLFSTSCLNPGLYIWRMNDVRNGVKKLCCCTNGFH